MTLQGGCWKSQIGGLWEPGNACASVLRGFREYLSWGFQGGGGEEWD